MKNDEALSVVLTAELKEKVKEMAKKKNISINSLVRLALTEYLERNN